MKIVDVRTVIVDAGWRNWVFVIVDTDEHLTGYGECTLGRTRARCGWGSSRTSGTISWRNSENVRAYSDN